MGALLIMPSLFYNCICIIAIIISFLHLNIHHNLGLKQYFKHIYNYKFNKTPLHGWFYLVGEQTDYRANEDKKDPAISRAKF